MHVYDPATKSWTDLSDPVSGIPASPRDSHGFTAAEGKLYVYGGEIGNGDETHNIIANVVHMQRHSKDIYYETTSNDFFFFALNVHLNLNEAQSKGDVMTTSTKRSLDF